MRDRPERNDMKKRTIPVFAVLAAAGIATSIYSIFFQAPLQYGLNEDGKLNGSSLFFNQKIFYFHTAHAMLMIVAVVSAGVASILFLLSRMTPDPHAAGAGSGGVMGFIRSRSSTWDDIASASDDVAVAFGAIAILA